MDGLRRTDVLGLAGYCLLLFGVALVAGRPLTLHESVLPQSAREMLADGDWLVPKKGGTPWLESPPLPQWITVGLATPFGRCDSEAIVRLGPLLVGTLVVLLTAWMAAVWYGRMTGILAGLVMATTCQFTRYAWLAEDEIFLCGVITAAVAAFVRCEFVGRSPDRETGVSPLSAAWWGGRDRWVTTWYVLLGMTNLVKGLIFGFVLATAPVAFYLAGTRDLKKIGRYAWIWGVLLTVAIAAAWPLAVLQRFPDAKDVWFFDLGGRMSGEYKLINQPVWYYPVNLLWMIAPWTIVLPWAIAATARRAWNDRTSSERFLWCWSLGTIAVLSIPGGKHHHYLLHALAPWAILSAQGLERLWARWPAWPSWAKNPWVSLAGWSIPAVVAAAVLGNRFPDYAGLTRGLAVAVPLVVGSIGWSMVWRQPRWCTGVVFGWLLTGYVFGHWYAGTSFDKHRVDVAFLKEVRERAEESQLPLYIDLSRTPLSGFLDLFYQADTARPLHNASFLLQPTVETRRVLVLSRAMEHEALAKVGHVEQLAQSPRDTTDYRGDATLTLFAVDLDPARITTDQPARISPMQAMHREPGPDLTVWR